MVIFIPFGLYVSLFSKNKKILKTVIFAFCISLFFEVFQLFTLLGGGSTKDIITNTFGALIGALIYRGIYSEDRIKYFNIISIVVIVIAVPLLMYAIVNTIINIETYVGIVLRTL